MGEFRSALNVLLIGLGCALVLALSHTATRERIEVNESQALRSAIADLTASPAALPVPIPDLSPSPAAWRLCDGTVLIHATVTGYGGPMSLLFTVVNDGSPRARLHRLVITGHQETPGITDFLKNDGGWLSTLRGRTSAELPDVDTVSGATITSRALRDHLSIMLGEAMPEVTLPEGCEP